MPSRKFDNGDVVMRGGDVLIRGGDVLKRGDVLIRGRDKSKPSVSAFLLPPHFKRLHCYAN